MTSEAQRQSDLGDEHADDLTVEQAIGAIKRCERVSWDALVVNGDDTLGEERHTTRVVVDGVGRDEPTSYVVDLIRCRSRRIWWGNNHLVFGYDLRIYHLPEVYPLQPRTCMFCSADVHSGRCVVADGPNHRKGASA